MYVCVCGGGGGGGVKGKYITATDDYGDGDVYRNKKERC